MYFYQKLTYNQFKANYDKLIFNKFKLLGLAPKEKIPFIWTGRKI